MTADEINRQAVLGLVVQGDAVSPSTVAEGWAISTTESKLDGNVTKAVPTTLYIRSL